MKLVATNRDLLAIMQDFIFVQLSGLLANREILLFHTRVADEYTPSMKFTTIIAGIKSRSEHWNEDRKPNQGIEQESVKHGF